MAVTSDQQSYLGEDIRIVVTLAETDDDTGSIAGRTFEAVWVYRPTKVQAVAKTVGSGVTISDAAGREITITLADSDFTLRGTYDWSVWDSEEGSEAALVVGTWTVLPSSRAY